ncbi:MAG TPA: hypothetical protein PLP19_14625 [bacterium]|nr:hypothetical protein [bacterium]HPN44726.1 hypothetical protein [bacterium]
MTDYKRYFFHLWIVAITILSAGSGSNTINCRAQDADRPGSVPEILARVTFDERSPGEHYGNRDVKQDFGTNKSWGTYWPVRRLRVVQADSIHDKVLQVQYPKGKVRSFASGGSWRWQVFAPRQEVYFSFWTLFPDSFVFRQGGKLHGLVGGKGNTGGDKPNGHDGWSCRVHWGENDFIKLYIYHKDQAGQWGDVFYFTDKPGIITITPGTPPAHPQEGRIRIETGKWHHIIMRVFVNTPGQRDGQAQAWYDGKLAVDVRGLEFRDSLCNPEQLLIDGMYFSTFFGGRDESYMPVKDEYILFDDFILSTGLYCPPGMACELLVE